MEPNDEVVERQKLVDVETEEDVTNSAPKSAPTPASPMAVPKINIKSISSGETTRSRNSASCSIERSDKVGQTSAKVTYINERRPRPHLHGTNDERFEFKSRPRKLLKDCDSNSLNDITQLSSSDTPSDESTTNIDGDDIYNNTHNFSLTNNKTKINHNNNNICTTNLSQPFTAATTIASAVASVPITLNNIHHHHHSNDDIHQAINSNIIIHKNGNNSNSTTPNSSTAFQQQSVIANTTTPSRRKPSVGTSTGISVSAGYPGLMSSVNTSNSLSDKFDQRPIKHHSFVSEVPDVKHMERALLGLLDDFHTGKLKAFGSGCTMDQMTKIREQQESLAKLHFELAASEEDSLENGNDFNAAKAQENMLQLMQRLEQLSISIEQLQTSHTGL
ncbi:uncharacterized protein isoform X2 [Musca autumnalis]|uniref:uncharacterized protein isoform X2 n=1 Tax=Musca autumnalis TaxID=221902 RepID=UPI003CF4AC9F